MKVGLIDPRMKLLIDVAVRRDAFMADTLGMKSGQEYREVSSVGKINADRAEAKRIRRAARNSRNAERMKK